MWWASREKQYWSKMEWWEVWSKVKKEKAALQERNDYLSLEKYECPSALVLSTTSLQAPQICASLHSATLGEKLEKAV